VQGDLDRVAVRIVTRQGGRRAGLDPVRAERHADDEAGDPIEIANLEGTAAPRRVPLDPVQDVLNRPQNRTRMPTMIGSVQRELSSLMVSSPVPARSSIWDRPDIQRRPTCP
jgi:hypothetical protein